MQKALPEPELDQEEETSGPPLSVEEKLDLLCAVVIRIYKKVMAL